MINTSRRDKFSQADAWFGQFWKLLTRLAGIAFAAYFLWRVRSILTDVLVAAIFAFVLIGPVDWLCRFRIRRIGARAHRLIATLLVFAAVVLILLESAALMVSPFQAEALRLKLNLPHYEQIIADYAQSAKSWYAALPPDLRALLQKPTGAGGGAASPADWVQHVVEGTVAGVARIVDIVLIPVLAFYFVLDGHALRNEFLALVPRRRLRETLTLLRESATIMRVYVIGQLWLCVIAGVVVYVGLSLIHMNYALMLGLLAGFTRAIPIIGPVLGGIPIILLAAVTQGPVQAVKVLIFFSVLHLVESKFIMPKFIGHRIHLHAVVVIIVLLIGGEFFGLLGMFLAAPLAAVGRILINYYVIRPRRLAARAISAATVSQPPLIIKAQ